MKTLCVAVILLLGIILESAGAELQSSVDSNALCPGERVTFSCTVPSLSHQWRITNGSTSQIIGSVSSGSLNAVGGFGFELTVVDRTATSITSTAMVNTTTDLSGTVIVCRDFLVPLEQAQQQNTTVNIIGSPTAPGITMLSKSNQTMDSITIKADLQLPVYGSQCIQNYTVIARADGEEDVRGVSTSPDDLFVLVSGLSVCPRQYTFTAVACSPVGCSNESTPETFNITNGLLSVTNIAGDGSNLRWNQPQNAPPDCIMGYTITWDDGMFTTPDNGTSFPIDDIPGLDFCRTYTSINVTSIVPLFGNIQSSSGESSNVILLPSGFPGPGNVDLSDPIYNETGIEVTASWQNSELLLNYSMGIAVVAVRDNITESGTRFQEPNLPNSHQLQPLPYSVSIGRTIGVSVTFMSDNCTSTAYGSGDRPLPNIIGLTARTRRTTSSLEVTITYNVDINVAAGVTVDVRGTATPSDDSHGPIVIIIQGPITRSELTFVFPNLNPGTGYTCVFETMSRNNPSARIGMQIDLDLQTLSVSSIVGPAVGGALGGLVVVGVAAAAVGGGGYVLNKKSKKRKGQKDEDVELKEPSPDSSPTADSGPPTAVYADPNTIQREEFPGTQDVYTVPDKTKKKHKPEDHLPTYQDPNTISHEVAPTGDMYAQPDKPKKPRGSKKNQQEAPPPTQEQLAEMYSQPDKSKKQQSQGLTYTHIDFHGSGKVPDTQPGVVYSDVKPQ